MYVHVYLQTHIVVAKSERRCAFAAHAVGSWASRCPRLLAQAVGEWAYTLGALPGPPRVVVAPLWFGGPAALPRAGRLQANVCW
jgi:hypothetical protein